MKISDFIIILGVLVLANSIYSLGNIAYYEIWDIVEDYDIDWNLADTLRVIFHIMAPALIIGVGVWIRLQESR